MVTIETEMEESGVMKASLREPLELEKRSLWKVIAKNEIRIKTSKFRNHRILFFVCLYSVVAAWAFFLCPYLFGLLMPLMESEMAEIFKPFIALLIETILMAFFLMLIMYPLQSVYKKTEIGFKEILLASPADAGDIFTGEFVGKLPTYSAAVLIFAPVIIALVNPILNLNLIQYIVIYLAIFGLVIFSTLFGTVLACWLEHKIAKNEKARDLGKVLMFLISILMVVIIYSMEFFFTFLIDNPELKNWIFFYPPLWFTNIILYVIDPVLIEPYILDIWTSSALAIGMPLLLMYFAFKKADSFYTLEGGIEKANSSITHEIGFYKAMRRLTGKKWGGLVSVQLKIFFRKKDNIMKLIYVGGLTSFFAWVITIGVVPGGNSDSTLYIDLMSAFIIIMVGMMFSMMLGHYIFVDSKDILWIYKRSPRNVSALVYSYLIQMVLISLLVIIPVSIVHAIVFKFDLLEAFFHFVLITAFCLVSMIQTVSIQCINPSFEEKGKSMSGNVFISLISQIVGIVLLVVMLVVFEVFENSSPSDAKIVFIVPLLVYHAIVAIFLFIFGMRRLNRME